jgi:hypothetical protein
MKIYEKIIIDMSSGETLLEISFEHSGKVAKCKGGGGGGGAPSGKVDYPTYMKDQHLTWLTDVATDITNARTGNSPYFTAAAFDPDTNLTAMGTAITAFNVLVDGLAHLGDWVAAVAQAKSTIDAFYDPTTQLGKMDTAICVFDAVVDSLNYANDWDAAMDQAKATIDTLIDDTYINADVVAYADTLDDQVDNVTIPKFQRGLQDINAVQSSAFVLGEALIYGMRDRDVAKFLSELRMKLNLQRNELITNSAAEMIKSLLQRVEFERAVVEATIKYNSMHVTTELTINEMFLKSASQMLQDYMTKVDFEKAVAHYSIEHNRMAIVAEVDYNKQDIELDELDARWDLNTFAFGSNVMGSIAGAATNQGEPQKSQAASALGGALSGAAAGYKVGGGYGAAAGAILGGLSAYL